jgi:hypothetical protein
VYSGVEGCPRSPPKPPSAFWADSRKAVGLAARAGAGAAASAARATTRIAAAAPAGSQRISKRSRKRMRARTNAGPNARQKTTLPAAWATLNVADVALKAR